MMNETMRNKEIILPKIYRPPDKSISGWYVYFSVYNEFSDKMERFKRTRGFTTCETVEECQKVAYKLKNKYTKKLINGWTPFNDKSVIWKDNLVYHEVKKKRTPIRRSKKTISFFCSKYLDEKKRILSPASYHKYVSELRIFEKWLLNNKVDIIDITLFDEENARNFINYLHYNKELKGSTINNYLITLQGVWNAAKKNIKLLSSPWDDINRFPKSTMPQRPLKQGIIAVLKNYLEENDPQLWLAAQFMYYCFIRPKELRFMKIKHLDLFEGKATVFADIAKTDKTRTVEIHNSFLTVLWSKYRLNDYPEEYYIFSTKREPSTQPVGKNYFWSRFNVVRKRLNIPNDYKFYGFKHTGAVRAIKAGANIKEIQGQMGHSSIETTDEYIKSMVGYESEFFKKDMPTI